MHGLAIVGSAPALEQIFAVAQHASSDRDTGACSRRAIENRVLA